MSSKFQLNVVYYDKICIYIIIIIIVTANLKGGVKIPHFPLRKTLTMLLCVYC